MISCTSVDLSLAGNQILNNVSVSFEPGTLTCIIGPNGAGKSTLLSALVGDQEVDRGEVTLDDRPIQTYKPKELARRRSVLPQDHLVRFSYSVDEIVHLARLSYPMDPEVDERIVTDSISSVEMQDMRNRDVQTLSGGEMGRTAFARVLAQTTPVVFLDEPTSALDLRHQEAVLKRARLLRDNGAAVIIVLHDLNLAAAYADRVILMANGQIVADGAPSQVLTEEIIQRVYRQAVIVTKHPTRNCPLIVPTD